LLEIGIHPRFGHTTTCDLDLYFQSIFPHVARWRSLSLVSYGEAKRKVIEYLCTIPAPHLDRLRLSLSPGDPTLRFVTGNLKPSIYSSPLPFKTITSLRLNTAPSYDQLGDVLLGTPLLVNLDLCLWDQPF
jgi:hypothetical protein